MIVDFGNKLARDLVEDRRTKETRSFTPELRRRARAKLAMLHAAKSIEDLRMPPGNRLEKLKGDLRGFYSIRINERWRVVFRFHQANAHGVIVEDYHR